MNNELIEQKSWWKKNWKWFIPVSGLLLLICSVFISSEIMGIGTDFAQAYSDTELYKDAIKKVESDQKVKELLGEIEPIDKFAILEGEVNYSNGNQSVNSTLRIQGTKGKAKMDISADRVEGQWVFKKINVRIKNSDNSKQTIEIIRDSKK
ncbi:hypothetical protein P700755_001296 [Psychroflexus torquis ATCC 700755]|uniref:Cytochrome oxidase complex assembly protein 1 n=1 Tax=Psychroflexus torquis (strain ATCC 700755 / CIP 106069 / ACAM 623) TaxID=313595 RepID=K4IRX9_PSYTT|nr:cytochrome c oxidase assembly factor Coa1 family protein [Psychroflexus torquis]AFU68230.1 hypothetical protein P700755_001296 [Psychroflexus torquis ATCC 700755]